MPLTVQLLIQTACFVICIALARATKNNGIFTLIFSVLFILVMFGGIPIVLAFDALLDISTYNYHYHLISTIYATTFYITYASFILALPKFYLFKTSPTIDRSTVKIFSLTLIATGLGALAVFFALNGFLFFKNNDYDELFSASIKLSWIRKFFYFFFPGMIIWFLLNPTKNKLRIFLIACLTFGGLSFFIVGGSRASIALSIAYACILGVLYKHIKAKSLLLIFPILAIVMSWLAIIRYSYQPEGPQLAINMFSLIKGTLSPLDNVAAIVQWTTLSDDTQGLWPVVRDFYQYIPKSMWLEKTEIILNTGNYLTTEILQNSYGLTFSPTIIGSALIMLGFAGPIIFGFVVAILNTMLDSLFARIHPQLLTPDHPHKNAAILLGTFCISIMFYYISMVRDGIDTFLSRLFFFGIVYALLFIGSLIFSRITKYIQLSIRHSTS